MKRLLVAVLLCLLAAPARSETTSRDAASVSSTEDVRLAKHLHVACYRATLRQLVVRLGEQSGVTLRVTGECGAEPLVAFVPDAALAEVMLSLEELYRLHWSRAIEGGEPVYTLLKTPAASAEEDALRRAAERTSEAGLRRAAEAVRQNVGDLDSSLAASARELTQEQWAELLERGTLDLSLERLPAEQQRALLAVLAPAVTLLGGDAAQPLTAEQGVKLAFEVDAGERARLSVGLSGWGRATGGDWVLAGEPADAAGRGLYVDRSTRPDPAAPPPVGVFEDSPPALEIAPGERLDWVEALARLSAKTRLPIYADAYPDSGTRRIGARLRGASLSEALDRFCTAQSVGETGSFWWQRGSAGVLIRSREWLAQSRDLLPEKLVERLRRALTAPDGRLAPADLESLAGLSPGQVRSLAEEQTNGRLGAWRRAVQVPARLSAAAREAYLQPGRTPLENHGLTWNELSAEDRDQLLRLPGPPLNGETPRFEVRLNAYTATRGTVARTRGISFSADSTWGDARGRLRLWLPLPDESPGDLLVTTPVRPLRALRDPPRLVAARYYVWAAPEAGRPPSGPPVGEPAPTFKRHSIEAAGGASGEALRRDVRQMKEAGVDLLVSPWEGAGGLSEKTLATLAAGLKESGLRLCLSLSLPSGGHDPVAAARTLGAAVRAVTQQPGYQKLDGRPVFFFERREPAPNLQTIADALSAFEAGFGSPVAAVISMGGAREAEIGDGLVPLDPATAWREAGGLSERLRTLQSEAVNAARARGRLAVAEVCPGRDAADGLAGSPRGAAALKGALYHDSWLAALEARPDWVLIDSFNGWHEGSEVAPSVELGEQRLRITKEFTTRFRRERSSSPDR